jgi:hypothetical protein
MLNIPIRMLCGRPAFILECRDADTNPNLERDHHKIE